MKALMLGLVLLGGASAKEAIMPVSNANGSLMAVIQDTFTTVFTGPTTFMAGTVTHEVEGPTTLVVTDCPCTWTTSVQQLPTIIATASGSAPPTSKTVYWALVLNSTKTSTSDSAHVSTNGAAKLGWW